MRTAVALLLSFLALHTAYAQGPAVTLFSVEETEMSHRLYATGTLQSRYSTELRTQVTGRITELNMEDGAYVEQGELLVRLDDREPQARLLQAEVDLREAQRQLARFQRLEASQSISQDQLDQQQARVDNVQAQILAAQAEVERYRILAPFSGFLGEQDLTPGMLLDSGQVLTTLDDLSQMRVNFSLAERHLSLLASGQRIQAEVLAWPEQSFQGEVVSLGTRIDPVTRNLPVRGRLDNPDQLLRPGMLATLTLETTPRPTLLVPSRSLTYDGSEKAVFLIDSEGQAQRRLVETGTPRAEYIEITAGLEAGDQVVDEGVVKVREGIRVRVIEAESQAL